MKTSLKNRIGLAIAALLLVPVFVLPLWSIGLIAPQYPEGLGMDISINEVRGHEEFDIQNINILNHYIGMRPIPEHMPEFDIFPPVLAALVITGLLAAAIGRRWAMTTWFGVLVAAATAGMIDFYLWLLDYGHNLDPLAPIRIPGASYTPPLIGTKQLLNITASSWPAMGSIFLFISIGLATYIMVRLFRKGADERERSSVSPTPVASMALATVVMAALVVGCSADVDPEAVRGSERSDERITYGVSEDPYCGGLVDKVRWGGEIEASDGRHLRFRSVECMAGYLLENGFDKDEIVSVKAVDFPDGWNLIEVKDAHFLHTPNLASPAERRLNVMAISTMRMATNLQEAYTGPIIGWDEVLHRVAEAWALDHPPSCPFHEA